MLKQIKKMIWIPVLAGTLALTACGGGSSSSPAATDPAATDPAAGVMDLSGFWDDPATGANGMFSSSNWLYSNGECVVKGTYTLAGDQNTLTVTEISDETLCGAAVGHVYTDTITMNGADAYNDGGTDWVRHTAANDPDLKGVWGITGDTVSISSTEIVTADDLCVATYDYYTTDGSFVIETVSAVGTCTDANLGTLDVMTYVVTPDTLTFDDVLDPGPVTLDLFSNVIPISQADIAGFWDDTPNSANMMISSVGSNKWLYVNADCTVKGTYTLSGDLMTLTVTDSSDVVTCQPLGAEVTDRITMNGPNGYNDGATAWVRHTAGNDPDLLGAWSEGGFTATVSADTIITVEGGCTTTYRNYTTWGPRFVNEEISAVGTCLDSNPNSLDAMNYTVNLGATPNILQVSDTIDPDLDPTTLYRLGDVISISEADIAGFWDDSAGSGANLMVSPQGKMMAYSDGECTIKGNYTFSGGAASWTVTDSTVGVDCPAVDTVIDLQITMDGVDAFNDGGPDGGGGNWVRHAAPNDSAILGVWGDDAVTATFSITELLVDTGSCQETYDYYTAGDKLFIEEVSTSGVCDPEPGGLDIFDYTVNLSTLQINDTINPAEPQSLLNIGE